MQRENIKINAAGKSLGRVATEAARFLQGKHVSTWSPNQDRGAFVVIQNVKDIKFTGNKINTKKYYRHTNYPGNMKIATLKEMWAKDPKKLCSLVISKMLPKNKLRKEMLKRISFE